jgi:ubiquinone/menaquinone biosynthesis C-methylase UbiE
MPSFLSFIVDSKWRKKIQPVKKIIEISEIKPGMMILDFGCGPGTYTIDFARATGSEGKVYAADIQPKMIEKLLKKLEQPNNKNIKNIETKITNAYKLPFPDKFFDIIFMIGVLPEIPDRTMALKEMKRVLKNSGVLTISETIFDPDYPLQRTTKKFCSRASFELKKSWTNFFSYTFQFQKNNQNPNYASN